MLAIYDGHSNGEAALDKLPVPKQECSYDNDKVPRNSTEERRENLSVPCMDSILEGLPICYKSVRRTCVFTAAKAAPTARLATRF